MSAGSRFEAVIEHDPGRAGADDDGPRGAPGLVTDHDGGRLVRVMTKGNVGQVVPSRRIDGGIGCVAFVALKHGLHSYEFDQGRFGRKPRSGP